MNTNMGITNVLSFIDICQVKMVMRWNKHVGRLFLHLFCMILLKNSYKGGVESHTQL